MASIGVMFLMLISAGCGSKSVSAANGPAPPPLVETVDLVAQDVPIYSEFAAQTFARNRVEVRGRVDGYIEKWLFKPGDQVKEGQALYIMDLRRYQAAVDQASGNVKQTEADVSFAQRQVALEQTQANLASADAALSKAQNDFNRLKPLVEQDAAPKQDLDTATTLLRAAEANVRANRANVEQARLSTSTQIQSTQGKLEAEKGALETAKLNLQYGTITAPISGVIGDTQIPVGGKVDANAAQPLSVIVPLDPMWVRIQMSEAQYLEYGRRRAAGLQLELLLADGSVFAHHGTLDSVLNQIDPRTGTLEVQARFPNPEGRLLPGQFGRVRFQTGERKAAILVPQRAVQQVQSTQTVYTVNANNQVEAHAVKTQERVGENWVVGQGLKPGEKVVVEGQLRIRPGVQVTMKPFQATGKGN
ncbi:MAG: efflux RND transporter periplasmic adaptor subunit [Acidobacteriota bacterium]